VLRLVGVLALVSSVAPAAGCTIIFNSNDLPRRSDAAPEPDSRITDATLYDVNPAGLALSSVEPTSLIEGTGTDGGRPVVVLVRGTNIDDHATLTISAGADAVPLGLIEGTVVVSNDHTMIALPVTVPVIGNLGKGQQLHLLAKVSQAGASDQTLDITVDGLPELATSGATDGAAVTAGGPYSKATLSAATQFTGKSPVHVRVTGGITVSALLKVDAGGSTAGPGGCDGGGPGLPGGCTPGGGGGGAGSASGVSGGGGGFGAAGKGGAGTGAGTAGAMTGDEMLVKLDYNSGEAGNRGNGGGGGGGALLGLGTPGSGGGGGGTLELTAGGAIVVSGAGAVSAKGGDGGTGGGVGGGDGGAGAGGAILVRSGGGVSASGTWLTAPAGGLGGGDGGTAAIGRIRVDSPTGTVASMADPTATQGPSWAVGTGGAPAIARATQTTLPFIGQSGRSYAIIVNAVATTPVMLTTSSTAAVPVSLKPGHNAVCAIADGNAGNAGNEVARECIDVTLLP
jgi:hypothetical protein